MLRVRAELPDASRPRRLRGWWIGVLGFAAIAVAMFGLGWENASHPNGYKGRNVSPADWVFPRDAMIDFGKLLAVELGLIALLFQVPGRGLSLTKRSLLFAIVMFAFLVVLVPFGMHSSAPYGEMLLTQLLGTVWLVVFAIGTGVAAKLRNEA